MGVVLIVILNSRRVSQEKMEIRELWVMQEPRVPQDHRDHRDKPEKE